MIVDFFNRKITFRSRTVKIMTCIIVGAWVVAPLFAQAGLPGRIFEKVSEYHVMREERKDELRNTLLRERAELIERVNAHRHEFEQKWQSARGRFFLRHHTRADVISWPEVVGRKIDEFAEHEKEQFSFQPDTFIALFKRLVTAFAPDNE